MQEHMLMHDRKNNCVYATLCTCYSVWVTGMQEHMLLHTRRNNRVYATLGKYSVWVTVWYAGAYAHA